MDKCCDNCKYYSWHYDYCKKYQSIINNKSVCTSFQSSKFKKLFTKIKAIINDIDYECWNTRIMSDALEFDIDENTVERWLDANYRNHYERD